MPKQEKLEGFTDKVVEEIEQAAERYVEARDARMAKGLKEQEAQGVLLGILKKHKKLAYATSKYEITVTNKEKVKVKSPKDESEE